MFAYDVLHRVTDRSLVQTTEGESESAKRMREGVTLSIMSPYPIRRLVRVSPTNFDSEGDRLHKHWL